MTIENIFLSFYARCRLKNFFPRFSCRFSEIFSLTENWRRKVKNFFFRNEWKTFDLRREKRKIFRNRMKISFFYCCRNREIKWDCEQRRELYEATLCVWKFFPYFLLHTFLMGGSYSIWLKIFLVLCEDFVWDFWYFLGILVLMILFRPGWIKITKIWSFTQKIEKIWG